MKTIGLIGGMSWESTLEYYRMINEGIRDELGGDHTGELVIYSFDFNSIVEKQERREWDELEDMMVEAGNGLKKSGADFLLICANTMNRLADGVEEKVGLPLLNIVDATGEEIKEKGLAKVLLLGTEYVMAGDFYRDKLKRKYGVNVVVPEEDKRKEVHRIIYEELCRGVEKTSSKEKIISAVKSSIERGAEGVILGCTELPLILGENDLKVPTFNTTEIHSKAAVKMALQSR